MNLKAEITQVLQRSHTGRVQVGEITRPTFNRALVIFTYSYNSTISKSMVHEIRAACFELDKHEVSCKWDMIVA